MISKSRLAGRSLAEGTASLVLREMKIDGLRVDPIAIAASKGILVQAKPVTIDGVSGMVVKAGDQFGIMYATNSGTEPWYVLKHCSRLRSISIMLMWRRSHYLRQRLLK